MSSPAVPSPWGCWSQAHGGRLSSSGLERQRSDFLGTAGPRPEGKRAGTGAPSRIWPLLVVSGQWWDKSSPFPVTWWRGTSTKKQSTVCHMPRREMRQPPQVWWLQSVGRWKNRTASRWASKNGAVWTWWKTGEKVGRSQHRKQQVGSSGMPTSLIYQGNMGRGPPGQSMRYEYGTEQDEGRCLKDQNLSAELQNSKFSSFTVRKRTATEGLAHKHPLWALNGLS